MGLLEPNGGEFAADFGLQIGEVSDDPLRGRIGGKTGQGGIHGTDGLIGPAIAQLPASIRKLGLSIGDDRREAGGFRLMLMDLATGTSQGLTDTTQDRHPSFAPNGRLLVYATRVQGQHVLMTTTLDGGTRSLLASSSAEMREPAWGPFSPR